MEKLQKETVSFCCELCDYNTCRKSSWVKHINTEKHILKNDKLKVSKKYTCASCDYITIDKNKWEKHIKTDNHFMKNDVVKVLEKYTCSCCDYMTRYKSNWQRHIVTEKHLYKSDLSKVSTPEEKEVTPISHHNTSETDILKITTMFIETMKKNQDFQKEILGVIKESTSNNNSHNTITTNSNNTNKFNLNFFLNETCKDAMNLSEFVESLKITLNDLENVGKLGYTEGISRIFTKGLKELDVNKRPIHCSDLKRETVYVKNANKWEKEGDQLKRAIKQITNKNIKLIPKWKEENPGHHQYHNNKNDDYLKIMYESMGPTDELEEEKTFGKIITNLAKETVILK
jgi:hypothetical protein